MKTLESLPKILSPDHNDGIEFRHISWFFKEVHDLLSSLNAIFCVLSASNLPSDAAVTGRFTYVRFHGIDLWYNYHYCQ